MVSQWSHKTAILLLKKTFHRGPVIKFQKTETVVSKNKNIYIQQKQDSM